jgi:hypothetical protein
MPSRFFSEKQVLRITGYGVEAGYPGGNGPGRNTATDRIPKP